LDKKPQTCAPLNEDHSFGYSTKVLIHGWQRRRLQVVPQLERLSIQASRNKCVVSLVKSAVHVALPAFAAQRRAAAPCCGAVAAGRPPLSIDVSCLHGA